MRYSMAGSPAAAPYSDAFDENYYPIKASKPLAVGRSGAQPVRSAATADRARRIRAVRQARCRKAQNASAIRQPPGTIRATTAYRPRSRIGPARSASRFMGRSNIAASRVRIRQSPKVINYRISAERHVNSPRPSRGRDTEPGHARCATSRFSQSKAAGHPEESSSSTASGWPRPPAGQSSTDASDPDDSANSANRS